MLIFFFFVKAKWIQSLHDQNGMPNAQVHSSLSAPLLCGLQTLFLEKVCGIRFDEPKEKVLALLTEYSKLSTVRGMHLYKRGEEATDAERKRTEIRGHQKSERQREFDSLFL